MCPWSPIALPLSTAYHVNPASRMPGLRSTCVSSRAVQTDFEVQVARIGWAICPWIDGFSGLQTQSALMFQNNATACRSSSGCRHQGKAFSRVALLPAPLLPTTAQVRHWLNRTAKEQNRSPTREPRDDCRTASLATLFNACKPDGGLNQLTAARGKVPHTATSYPCGAPHIRSGAHARYDGSTNIVARFPCSSPPGRWPAATSPSRRLEKATTRLIHHHPDHQPEPLRKLILPAQTTWWHHWLSLICFGIHARRTLKK